MSQDIQDLRNISIEKTDTGAEVSCVYTENSSAEGCLIILECHTTPTQECSIILIGETQSDIFQECHFVCSLGSLYAYAYSHGIVAENPSVHKENIAFDQYITYSTATATTPGNEGLTYISRALLWNIIYYTHCNNLVPTATNSPTTLGRLAVIIDTPHHIRLLIKLVPLIPLLPGSFVITLIVLNCINLLLLCLCLVPFVIVIRRKAIAMRTFCTPDKVSLIFYFVAIYVHKCVSSLFFIGYVNQCPWQCISNVLINRFRRNKDSWCSQRLIVS